MNPAHSFTFCIEDIFDGGWWDEYCEATGTNPHCVNEGRISIKECMYITIPELRKALDLIESNWCETVKVNP